MGTVRSFSPNDNHNPNIIKDDYLDLAAIKFLGSTVKNRDRCTFADFYRENYDHEEVYKSVNRWYDNGNFNKRIRLTKMIWKAV
jgi:hypothetical protein